MNKTSIKNVCRVYLASTLVVLCISACDFKKSTSFSNYIDDLSQETFEIDTIHHTLSSDTMLCIDYNIEIAKSGSIIADSINAGINQHFISGRHSIDIAYDIKAEMENLEKVMFAEIQEYYDPEDETYGNIQYNITKKGKFMDDSADSIISYMGITDSYTGGAHGSYIPITLNFSRNSGKYININDILKVDSHEKEILDLMLAQLLKDKGCTTREMLMEKTGILALGELYITNNFHMAKDSIVFCFLQYEIAPYSSGTIYVSLTYEQLKPYIK